MLDSTTTPEGGALETLDSDMIVDVCKGSGSTSSQLLMETSSLQKYEEVLIHQDASGAELNLNLSNPLSVGTLSVNPKLSDTFKKFEGLALDQAKREVERDRILEGSSDIEGVGA